MKEYESPKAEFVEFGNSRINTASSICNCYAEAWNNESYDLDNPEPGVTYTCTMVSSGFQEYADASIVG